jgi:cobalt-zinc-cadmium efflux system membrane fusion protein
MKSQKKIVLIVVILVLLLLPVAGLYLGLFSFKSDHVAAETTKPETVRSPDAPAVLELTESQVKTIKIGPAESHLFPEEIEAVGSIDFNEDNAVQVFPPYQGKIISAFAQLGQEVKKGQALYTIDSPDLVQAESALIAAAAVRDLTTKELTRAKELFEAGKGVSQRELEQATSDQQAAEGALNAARDAVRVFGKTEQETDQIVGARKIDPTLVVPSPTDGFITARNAQPGLLVQPGNSPAPYTVADVSTKWMLAFVSEGQAPLVQVGQPVDVVVMAFPGRHFTGKITAIAATMDPNTHRVSTRSEISDPKHELIAGMIASFTIGVHEPEKSSAVPANSVVREGDGTMSVWLTSDRRHFQQKTVKVGHGERDGLRQILDGVKPGDLVVSDGAVFLSNLLNDPPAD